MGYYSTIDPQLKFINKKKETEFEELEGLDDPITNNYGTYEDKDGNIWLEVHEHIVKMQDYREWVPILARYLKGSIEVWGEDLGNDIWRINFLGGGKYQLDIGEIKWKPVKLEDL